MNRLLFFCPILVLPFLTVSCNTNSNVEINGIPEFIAGGAQLSAEPEPMVPDPAIQHYDEESGPVELRIITDQRRYPEPPEKKKKVEKEIEYERGRDSRIRRLF